VIALRYLGCEEAHVVACRGERSEQRADGHDLRGAQGGLEARVIDQTLRETTQVLLLVGAFTLPVISNQEEARGFAVGHDCGGFCGDSTGRSVEVAGKQLLHEGEADDGAEDDDRENDGKKGSHDSFVSFYLFTRGVIPRVRLRPPDPNSVITEG
jgi:hypothetical protein